MKILENMRESTLIRTLETVYPNVDVEASLCSGTFYLKDDKACQDGISKNVCEKDCNREVLRINTTGHLVSVRWEPFIAGKVQACDYIIFNADGDLHRFAFCDLSCSLSRYVDNRNGKIGKREKVYNQLKSSWLFIKD